MNLRTKIALVAVMSVVIPSILITLLSVKSLNDNFEHEVETFRHDALALAKEQTKAKVDIVYNMIAKEYAHSREKAYIESRYGERIKNIVESAQSVVQMYHDKYQNNELTLEEAQARAKAYLRAVRFDDGKNYIFAVDMTYPFPGVVVHGLSRDLEREDITANPKWNTANGKNDNLFTATLDALKDNDSVFIDYLGPKTGTDELTTKLSYMSAFRPWGWVIGTGVYVDEVQDEFVANLKQTIASMRFDNGAGYYWINDTLKPFPKMVVHPIFPELDGQILDSQKWNSARGGTKNLFVEGVDLSLASGEGFIDYQWPKPMPDGVTAEQPKTSFVRYFEPLDWVIGTGIYVDYIDEQVEIKRSELEATLSKLYQRIALLSLVVLVIGVAVALFFGHRLSRAIVKLTEVAREISLGKGLEEKIEATSRGDEVGQLARAVERLQTSVKIMMKRMQKK